MTTELDSDPYLNSRRFLYALVILGLTSSTSGTVSPVLLATYVQNVGLTERAAGLVISAEAAGYAAAQLIFFFALYRWRALNSALLGLALVLGGNLLTIASTSGPELAAVRFVTGIGMGVIWSLVVSTVAHRRDAQRDYSIFTAVSLTYAASLFGVAPWIGSKYGLAGLMAFVLSLGVLGLAGAIDLRHYRGTASPRNHPIKSSAPAGFDWGTARLTVTCLLLYAGHNALWSYQQRVGLAVGLTPAVVGSLLGLSVLAGAAGAAIASVTGGRLGFSRPQWIAYAMLITAAVLFTRPGTAGTFISAAILVKVGWFYGYPLLQGALAARDPSGRAPVLGSFLQTVGATLGPGSAALVVGRGYSYVGGVGLLYYLISLPLAIGVLRKMDREAVHGPESAARTCAPPN